MKIVNDQFGAPTWSRDVANATAAVLGKWNDSGDLSGIFHLCAGGSTTWFDYAAEMDAAKKVLQEIQKGVSPI